MAGNQRWQAIPTQLDVLQFEEFVLPHLSGYDNDSFIFGP
jgi:hypothetical protein